MRYGELLWRIRRQLRLSRFALATLVGLSESTVGLVERGGRPPFRPDLHELVLQALEGRGLPESDRLELVQAYEETCKEWRGKFTPYKPEVGPKGFIPVRP